jgi:transcriptional regulator with XRE-family HTH domain
MMSTRLTKNEERALARRIGSRLKAARQREGLTQKEAGRLVGVATEVFGRFERGRILPSTPMLVGMCLALKVSPDDLLGMAPWAERPASPEQEALAALIPKTRHGARLLRAVAHLKPTQFRLVSRLVDSLAGKS